MMGTDRDDLAHVYHHQCRLVACMIPLCRINKFPKRHPAYYLYGWARALAQKRYKNSEAQSETAACSAVESIGAIVKTSCHYVTDGIDAVSHLKPEII